jgi:hypothetical protein
MVVRKLFRIAFVFALFLKAHCVASHRIWISHSHHTFFAFSHFFTLLVVTFTVKAPKSCEKCEKMSEMCKKKCGKAKNAKNCECDVKMESKFASHYSEGNFLHF